MNLSIHPAAADNCNTKVQVLLYRIDMKRVAIDIYAPTEGRVINGRIKIRL